VVTASVCPGPRATSARRWIAWPPPWPISICRPTRLERLKTAVSETAMNAIEYGSQSRNDVTFDVDVE
jgi:hypothetical protein